MKQYELHPLALPLHPADALDPPGYFTTCSGFVLLKLEMNSGRL